MKTFILLATIHTTYSPTLVAVATFPNEAQCEASREVFVAKAGKSWRAYAYCIPGPEVAK
jgi:hypothetical protein